MTVPHEGVQRTGWLFTRGNASVRMTVDDQATGLVLVVRGPGTASATYDFPDLKALMEFASLQEQQLQAEGFQLQAIAERRARDDRHEARGDMPERRRR